MQRWKAHIVKLTPEAKQFVKDYLDSLSTAQRTAVRAKIEETVHNCIQLGESVMFINPDMTGNKVKELLQLCTVIKFGKTFVYDDGEKAIPVTKANYKSIPYTDWLNESPYAEEII
jgi:hypothetical protein